MKQATLLFLLRDGQILLAMKKRGFGAGRWNGVGGKPNPDEPIEVAAIRECQEEISVTPVDIRQVATLNFIFPDSHSDWNQQVIVFLCDKWQGEPTESEEMSPKWFTLNGIPYDSMWQDDKYWLPLVLDSKHLKADFEFDESDNLLGQHIEEV